MQTIADYFLSCFVPLLLLSTIDLKYFVTHYFLELDTEINIKKGKIYKKNICMNKKTLLLLMEKKIREKKLLDMEYLWFDFQVLKSRKLSEPGKPSVINTEMEVLVEHTKVFIWPSHNPLLPLLEKQINTVLHRIDHHL